MAAWRGAHVGKLPSARVKKNLGAADWVGGLRVLPTRLCEIGGLGKSGNGLS